MEGHAPFFFIFAMDSIGTQSIADCGHLLITVCTRVSEMELHSNKREARGIPEIVRQCQPPV